MCNLAEDKVINTAITELDGSYRIIFFICFAFKLNLNFL